MGFRRHYLRELDRGACRPSSSIFCLSPRVLRFRALVLGLSWKVDMHEWASNQHGLWSSLWALAFVFLRVSARSRTRHFMLQNRQKTCKNEVPPKYMCKCENDQ